MGVEGGCFIFIFDEKGLLKERLGSPVFLAKKEERLSELFPGVWKKLVPFLKEDKSCSFLKTEELFIENRKVISELSVFYLPKLKQIILLGQLESALSRIIKNAFKSGSMEKFCRDFSQVFFQKEVHAFVWLGKVSKDKRKVIPAGWAGSPSSYFRQLEKELQADKLVPLLEALKRRKPVLIERISESNYSSSWKNFLLQAGWKSGISAVISEGVEETLVMEIFYREEQSFTETNRRYVQQLINGLKLVEDYFKTKAGEDQDKLKNLLFDFSEKSIAGFFYIEGLRVKYVNKELARMLGGEKEELEGENFLRFIHPEDRRKIVRAFKATGEKYASIKFSVRLLRKDGRTIHVEAISSILFPAPKISVVGTVIDVTERIVMEKKLKDHLEMQRALADFAKFSLQARSLRELTRKAAYLTMRILEADLMEVLNKEESQFRLIYTSDPELSFQLDQKELQPLLEGLPEEDFVLKFVKKPMTGRTTSYDRFFDAALCLVVRFDHFLQALFFFFKDEKRIPPEKEVFLKTVADIVRTCIVRKRTEEELRQSEQRLKTIFEKATDGLYLLKVERKGEYRYLLSNPVLNELGGVDFAGKKIEEVLPPDQVEKSRRIFDLIVETKSPFVSEEPIEFYSGKKDLLIERVPLINEKGEVSGIVGVVRDLTERKELQRKIEFQEKFASLGVLVRGILHEIKNALNAIMGHAQLGLMSVEEHSPLREYFQVILEKSEDINSFVANLLDFSAEEKREEQLIEMNLFLEKVRRFLKPMLKENINLSVKKLTRPIYVLADPGVLNQIFLNLISNSIDAMPSGGRIEIRLEEKEVDQPEEYPLEPGRYVKIVFSDTGVGIPKEIMHRIFEPFFTTKVGRAGAGLYQVYRNVKMMGGHLELKSEVGKGTEIMMYFPEAEVEETPLKSYGEAVKKGKGERILFVEDQELLLTIGTQLLEKIGYEVVAASSAEEALEKFRQIQGNFHLVITDLVLKGMSGADLIEKIREINSEVEFLVVTAYSFSGYIERLKALGVKHYLKKPFTAEKLSAKIREILDKG